MTNIHLFVLRLTQDHCHKWYEHFWDTKATEAFHYKQKGKNVEYDRNREHFSTEITGCLLICDSSLQILDGEKPVYIYVCMYVYLQYLLTNSNNYKVEKQQEETDSTG